MIAQPGARSQRLPALCWNLGGRARERAHVAARMAPCACDIPPYNQWLS